MVLGQYWLIYKKSKIFFPPVTDFYVNEEKYFQILTIQWPNFVLKSWHLWKSSLKKMKIDYILLFEK